MCAYIHVYRCIDIYRNILHIYICIYIYTYMYTFIYLSIHVQWFVCQILKLREKKVSRTYMYAYTHTYIYIHVQIYIYIHFWTRAVVCLSDYEACMRVKSLAHICMYTCKYIYVCMQGGNDP